MPEASEPDVFYQLFHPQTKEKESDMLQKIYSSSFGISS